MLPIQVPVQYPAELQICRQVLGRQMQRGSRTCTFPGVPGRGSASLCCAVLTVQADWRGADCISPCCGLSIAKGQAWQTLTKVQMARLALSDDLIAVPVLGQHGLVALPKGFMGADHEATTPPLVELHSKDAAGLQGAKIDRQLSTAAAEQTP